jgi:hypothetical protein
MNKQELLEMLWCDFIEKIKSEWDSKYAVVYGSFVSFPKMHKLTQFSERVWYEFERKFSEMEIDTAYLIRKSSTYQILQRNQLTISTKDKTLHTLSVYLGYQDWFDFQNKKRGSSKDLSANEVNFIPILAGSTPFETYDSERALLILAERLKEATYVYNTRITGKNVKKTPYSKKAMIWHEALKDFVPKDGTFLKEILSNLWIPEIQDLLLLDDYRAYNLNYEVTSFLNFIILYYKDGSKEVWIGWLLSEHKHLEQPCFVFREEKIVSLFMDWFKDLQKDSTEISPS